MSDEEFIKNEEGTQLDSEYCNKMTELVTGVGLLFSILVGAIAFIYDHSDLIKSFWA